MLLRPLLFLGLSALLLAPDWSTARPCRAVYYYAPDPCPVAYSYPAPVVCHYPQPVVYYHPAPVVYAPPLVYGPAICQMTVSPAAPVANAPATPTNPQGPRVYPERTNEPKAKTPEPKPEVQAPAPRVIQTVGNEERLPPMPVPLQQPRPVADPQPLPRLPLDFAQPKAIVEEAHKPAPVPSTPAPAKEPAKPAGDLPKFDLPPLPALAPPTIAKSSPLNADGVADVYPVAGPAPTDRAAARNVGFVNKSKRDVILTVAGRMTTLPSGQYLQLKLPAKFAWQIGGEPARDVTVPDTAPGVDVIIRR